MPHPYFDHPAKPRVVAHRGLVTSALAKQGIAENTRSAFASALAAGAQYLETDCHLTNDGVVVLLHDADLSRLAGDPRQIAQLSLAEIRHIMRDRGGVLTLAEALEEFPDARFNVDVKAAAAAEPIGRAVAAHGHRTLLTSFSDAHRLRALRAATAQTSGLQPATSAGRNLLIRVLAATKLGARRETMRLLSGVDALQIPEFQGRIRVFLPRLVDAAHAAGVEVHVWTVNDPEEMRSLVARGADGIVTDRADLAVAVLR